MRPSSQDSRRRDRGLPPRVRSTSAVLPSPHRCATRACLARARTPANTRTLFFGFRLPADVMRRVLEKTQIGLEKTAARRMGKCRAVRVTARTLRKSQCFCALVCNPTQRGADSHYKFGGVTIRIVSRERRGERHRVLIGRPTVNARALAAALRPISHQSLKILGQSVLARGRRVGPRLPTTSPPLLPHVIELTTRRYG